MLPIKVAAKSLQRQQQMLRAYPTASLLLLAILMELSYAAWREHAVPHLIAYLAAVWIGCLLTDIVTTLSSLRNATFPIKHSPLGESILVLACTLLGLALLAVRFSSSWALLHGTARVTLIVLLLVLVRPIALALIFILVLRYKPTELGINLRYWYLPGIVHVVFAALTLTVVPQLSHWRSFYHEQGLANGLFIGLFSAALPEEFTRMLLQTRLARLFHNQGLGFMLASILWALAHVPGSHRESPAMPVTLIAIQALHIVPLGLLWGYMTHRTKSLLPAVFMHGFNLWGLQNQI